MRRAPLMFLLVLAGCVQFRSVDFVVDLNAQKATFTYRDFTGNGEDDLESFVNDVLGGGQLTAEFPKAQVQRVEPVPNGEQLDVVVELGFTDPYAVGIRPWDKRTPYRFCAPEGLVITETNADFRDPDGCAVWRKSAKVLRVHAEHPAASGDPSLLTLFQGWDAAGRPPIADD